MDAFTQNLASENDGLVPLTTLVGKVLSHMSDCKAFGSLIVTMWKSAYFRSLLCSYGAHSNFFVRDWLFHPNKSDLYIKSEAKNVLFGTKAFKSRCLALRLDFAGKNYFPSLSFVPPLMVIVRLASQLYPEVSMVIQIATNRRLC